MTGQIFHVARVTEFVDVNRIKFRDCVEIDREGIQGKSNFGVIIIHGGL